MFETVLPQFNLSSHYVDCSPITGGHINQTFRVRYPNAQYVLQVVNGDVFTSIGSVMGNVSTVCEHLRLKGIPTLEYLPTQRGTYYTTDTDGRHVRVCKYVDGGVSLLSTDSVTDVHVAGMAFGRFCQGLADLPTATLSETIPNFHDTPLYLKRLFDTANGTTLQSRVGYCAPLLDGLYALRDYAYATQASQKSVVHNDVKLSNVLLDTANPHRSCVIDLDTVMAGYPLYDFADGVRSMCRNPNDSLNLDRYRAYRSGFFEYARGFGDGLLAGIVAISIELASRYLHEYLAGGDYFHLPSPDGYYLKAKGYLTFANDVIAHAHDIR
jgi:Ser/Thr protein kinase RdoA (MazF antagonist)